MDAEDKMVKSLRVAIQNSCCWPSGMPVNLQHCISSVLAQTLAPIRAMLRQKFDDKATVFGVQRSLRQEVETLLMGYDLEVGQFRADLSALEAVVSQLRGNREAEYPRQSLRQTPSATNAVPSGEGIVAAIAQAQQVAARHRSPSPCLMPLRPCTGGPPILVSKAMLEPLLAAGHVQMDCNGCLVMQSDNKRQPTELLPVYDSRDSEQYSQMHLLEIYHLVLQLQVERIGQRWCRIIDGHSHS